MKKIFTVLVLAAFALSGASAKKWTNNIGVGFTLPISTIGVDEKDADDISQIGYGVFGNLELRYLVAGASKESIEGKVKSGNKTTTITDSSDGPDLAGKFCIQPTIGVVWNF